MFIPIETFFCGYAECISNRGQKEINQRKKLEKLKYLLICMCVCTTFASAVQRRCEYYKFYIALATNCSEYIITYNALVSVQYLHNGCGFAQVLAAKTATTLYLQGGKMLYYLLRFV